MADIQTVGSKNLYKDDEKVYGKKINPVEVPHTPIGIDVDNEFYELLLLLVNQPQ